MYAVKLDEKDREILGMLMKDAKVSAKDISAMIDSPITTVYSRIKRLEDAGVIKGYKPILDAVKLGRPTTAFIFVSFTYRPLGADKDSTKGKSPRLWGSSPRFRRCILLLGTGTSSLRSRRRT